MKKSLKLLVLPAAMVLLTGNMTSCAPSKRVIAMISDVGDIDDGSFNQGCWEAVKKYGHDKNISYDYYRPFADSEFARKCAVKQAVTKGAQIIILPGFKFTSTSIDVANEYPDVHFVLIDSGIPTENSITHEKITIPRNLVPVTYDFQFSGWLAGYSVAKDYFHRDLKENDNKLKDQYGFGFMGGMANGGVFPFGFGYIQGILYAAQETTEGLGLLDNNKPQININYSYAGVFLQDDMACSTVKGWYANQKIDCVFSCGGKLYQSVTEALKYYNQHILPEKYRDFEDQKAPREAARWIGVDADQYTLVQDLDEKKSIYTSALKDVGQTCRVTLDYHFDNNWKALRDSMKDEDGNRSFNLGIDDQFVDGSTKEYDAKHDYVGVVEETQKDSNVLRGYNNVTDEDLHGAKTNLKNKAVEVYKGFNQDPKKDKIGQFNEPAGDPSTVFKSDEFEISEYNKYTHNEDKPRYPKDKFTIKVM